MAENDKRADGSGCDPQAMAMPLVGEVRPTGDAHLPFVVVDASGTSIEPVSEFLRELATCGNAAASVRSYAFDLLRWFRFLAAVGVDWSTADREDVRDFVAWLRGVPNPQRVRRADGPKPGAVNPDVSQRPTFQLARRGVV